MTGREMRNAAYRFLESRREEIIGIGTSVFHNPELSFQEYRTEKFIIEQFSRMKLDYKKAGSIPGVKAVIDTGRPGPGIGLIAEMDAVLSPDCGYADKLTGAAHTCGHNIQIAAMLGAGMALQDARILGNLCGSIHLIAVPAEEYCDFSYRKKLMEQGAIKYPSGKAEMICRGFFDGVDIAFLIHAGSPDKVFVLPESFNGMIIKDVRFIGKTAHAAGSPQTGVNALNAANIAMMAIHALRETFTDSDVVRVHPILAKGGEAVNNIPAEALLQMGARGKTVQAMESVNQKIDRAVTGAALCVGAQIEISNMVGTLPLYCSKPMQDAAGKIMLELAQSPQISISGHCPTSTDLGDVSAIMPVMHPGIGGIRNGCHDPDFGIADPDIAYIKAAQFMAGCTVEFLCEDARAAKRVIRDYKPVFHSKEEYMRFMESMRYKKNLSDLISGLER